MREVVLATGDAALAAWTPVAVATVAAALGAAGLSLVGAVVGGCWAIVRWRRDVHREERERYWQRLTFAFELLSSDDVGRSDIGFLLARAMYDMQKAPVGEEPGARVSARIIRQQEGDDGGEQVPGAHRRAGRA